MRRPGDASSAGGGEGAYSWDRSFRLWDTYFALIWLATLVFVLGTGHPGWPVRLTAAALLVPQVPLFVRVGRPLLRQDPPDAREALTYLGAMVALFLPSAILVGETRLMTFALVPQCFMTLRMRWALGAVAVINLVPVLGWALLWWPSDQDVFFNGLLAVVTLVFSVAVGSYVIRIIEQSQERAALIAELDTSRHEVSRLSAAHGALAERERMAREIHDTLAQGFTSLLMLVQAVEAELDHDLVRAHAASGADGRDGPAEPGRGPGPGRRRHPRRPGRLLAAGRAGQAGGPPHGRARRDGPGPSAARRTRGRRPARVPGGAHELP